jgi:hypothetical protein
MGGVGKEAEPQTQNFFLDKEKKANYSCYIIQSLCERVRKEKVCLC